MNILANSTSRSGFVVVTRFTSQMIVVALAAGAANAAVGKPGAHPVLSISLEALSNDIVVVGKAETKRNIIATAIVSREADLTLFLRDLGSDESPSRFAEISTDKQAAAVLKLRR